MKPKMSYAEIISQAQLMAAGLKTTWYRRKLCGGARSSTHRGYRPERRPRKTQSRVKNQNRCTQHQNR